MPSVFPTIIQWKIIQWKKASTFLLLLCLFCGLSFTVSFATVSFAATNEEKRLGAVQKALQNSVQEQKRIQKEDAQLDKTIRSLQRQSIEIAEEGSALETKVSALHNSLASLARKEQQHKLVLQKSRRELAKMTSILYHFYKQPMRSFILYPGSKKDAVTGEVLLRYWMPLLQEQIDAVEGHFIEIDEARKHTQRRLEELTKSNRDLKVQREKLAKLVASKRKVLSERRTQTDLIEKRLASLSREADNLQLLVDEMQLLQQTPQRRTRPDGTKRPNFSNIPEGIRNFPINGHIQLPSVGRVALAETNGHKNELRIFTLADAQVVAPFDGRVVHASSFGKLGKLVMIEHLGDFYSILWSLNRIDVVIGQWVLSGEPVGSVNGKVLHMQIRQRDKPVDPSRWVRPIALAP